MSILIKGVEMPKDCPMCPMSYWTKGNCEFSGCAIVNGKRYARYEDEKYANSYGRPSWCPLIEVPKHGLIDKQMLLRNIADNQFTNSSVGHEEDYAFWGKVWDYIFDAPTIIEAEPDCTTCPVKGKACKVFYRDKGDNSVCRELREAEVEDES